MTTVFIISAPSGSGKSTLVKRLLERDERLTFSISFTTRKPRGGEKHGLDYFFTDRNDFEAKISRGEFLEYAEVFGNYYGTHRSTLADTRKMQKDLVLDIDVQGARQLKLGIADAVSMFILAPSRQILEQRLRARGEDSQAVIERRLREAAAEIRNYTAYDYVIVNEDIEKSVDVLQSIVRAERVRRQRVDEAIQPILQTFDDGRAA